MRSKHPDAIETLAALKSISISVPSAQSPKIRLMGWRHAMGQLMILQNELLCAPETPEEDDRWQRWGFRTVAVAFAVDLREIWRTTCWEAVVSLVAARLNKAVSRIQSAIELQGYYWSGD